MTLALVVMDANAESEQRALVASLPWFLMAFNHQPKAV